MTPLVIAIGNPSRGDDALGPRFAEVIGGDVRVVYQLQPEHALWLTGRPRVTFVDAAVGLAAPFVWAAVAPAPLRGATHALTPAELVGLHAWLYGPPPPAFTLAIRGERFELGEGLSPRAAAALAAAVAAWAGVLLTG